MSHASVGSISVIVPVLNEEATIATLVDALTDQLRPDDELVVVDGGSTDATRDIVASKGAAVRLVSAPGSNISQARNRGIAEARNDVIACTDAGCTPTPEWLDALRACFMAEPRCDLVTGIYDVAARTPFEHAMAVACYPDTSGSKPGRWASIYGRLFGRTFDAALPTGRSMAFTKEAWAALGGFREDLATAEDVTFGRALVATGRAAALCSRARVTWEQRPTLGATARMYFSYGWGGGLSGDPKVAARDLIRGAAYGGTAWAIAAGGTKSRLAVLTGGVAYLSVPIARALKRPQPAMVAALVPFALATKDVAKASGFLAAVVRSRRGSDSTQRDVVDEERSASADGSLDAQHEVRPARPV